MIKKMKKYLTNESLIIQVVATLVATAVIWLITVLFGIIRGLNFTSSVNWSLKMLTLKVDLLWFLISVIIFGLVVFRLNRRLINKINELTYSKEQIDRKISHQKELLDKKLNISHFERFSDTYDYRRLKNHPFHELYTNDIESFLTILKEGNKTSDIYKVENAMKGLALELKAQGSIHSSTKNEIKEEINNCFTDKFLHQKEELNEVLDNIEVY